MNAKEVAAVIYRTLLMREDELWEDKYKDSRRAMLRERSNNAAQALMEIIEDAEKWRESQAVTKDTKPWGVLSND